VISACAPVVSVSNGFRQPHPCRTSRQVNTSRRLINCQQGPSLVPPLTWCLVCVNYNFRFRGESGGETIKHSLVLSIFASGAFRYICPTQTRLPRECSRASRCRRNINSITSHVLAKPRPSDIRSSHGPCNISSWRR
jgi:hypothetical protein